MRHVGRLKQCVQGFVGDLSERVHLEDLGVDGIRILKWIFKKWNRAWTGLIWLKRGKVASCLKCGKLLE
jgi:hypothetical protein